MYFFFLLGFIFTQYFFLNQFNSESKSNDNISDNQSWLEHSATQLQTKLVNYKSSFHFLLDENQYVYFKDRLLSNYADIDWLS